MALPVPVSRSTMLLAVIAVLVLQFCSSGSTNLEGCALSLMMTATRTLIPSFAQGCDMIILWPRARNTARGLPCIVDTPTGCNPAIRAFRIESASLASSAALSLLCLWLGSCLCHCAQESQGLLRNPDVGLGSKPRHLFQDRFTRTDQI